MTDGHGPLCLVIDQGGHASRAMVVDRQGGVIGSGWASIETQRPRAGWVEHDPEALLASVRSAIDDALTSAAVDVTRIEAAGLATQRSSVVCWDRRTGEALCPVFSWQDRRAAAWLERFDLAERLVHESTGLFCSPHYGVSKLRWALDHVPAVARAHRADRLGFGPLASFILHRMLDERPMLVDVANASRTLLLDIATLDWSLPLLERFGISSAALPACVPCRHDFGHLLVKGNRLPMIVCTGDQSAAVFSDGRPDPSVALINIGTGAFIQRAVGPVPRLDPELLASVVWQDREGPIYVQEGTVNGAGAAVELLAAECGIDREAVVASADLWLEDVAEPPLFINGVSGVGSPYWVPMLESRFVGFGEAPARLAAVLESIAFLLAINLRKLAAHPPPLRELVVSGGLSSIDNLCQRLADLSRLDVGRPQAVEATARGLAFLVQGQPEDWPHAPGARRFTPRPNPAADLRFERWEAAMEEAVAAAR